MVFPKHLCNAPLKARAQPCLKQDSKTITKSLWRKMRLVLCMDFTKALAYFQALSWGILWTILAMVVGIPTCIGLHNCYWWSNHYG